MIPRAARRNTLKNIGVPVAVPRIVEESIARKVKAGRGQGSGSAYMPWIRTQDFYSSGKPVRWWSWKLGRKVETFSLEETRCGRLLLWSPKVRDLREQFPLLPIEHTLEIAKALGVKHPADDKGLPVVMTTDFCLDLEIDGKIQSAYRAYKPVGKLSDRTLEKLEIERRYAVQNGVNNWGLITDADVPEAAAQNIEFLSGFELSNPERLAFLETERRRLRTLVSELTRSGTRPVVEICEWVDANGDSYGELCSLGALNTALGNKILPLDLLESYDPSRPLQPRSLALLTAARLCA